MCAKQKLAWIMLLIIIMMSVIMPVAALAESVGDDPAQPVQDKGGMFERAVAGLVDALVSVIEQLQSFGKLKSMNELVFNADKNGKTISHSYGPFNDHEWNLLNTWYMGTTGGIAMMALVAVIATAFKMMAASMNPLLRSEAVNSMWRWFMALFIIAGAPLFMWLVFYFNDGIVEMLVQVGQKVNADVSSLDNYSMNGDFIKSITTGSVLGTSIVKLAFAGLNLYLNMLYIVRFFVLAVIFVFTPIMAWMWALNKNVNAAAIWLGEVLSNAFMQTSHALTLLVFLTLTGNGTMGDNWLALIVGLLVILPITEMLRNSVQGLFAKMSGVQEEKWAGRAMLGVTGLGAIAGLGSLGKATFGGMAGGGMAGSITPPSGPGMTPGGPAGATAGISSGSGQIENGMNFIQGNMSSPGGTPGATVATMGTTTYGQRHSGIFAPGFQDNRQAAPASDSQNVVAPAITKATAGADTQNIGSKIGGAIGGAVGLPMMGRGGEVFARAGAVVGGAVTRGAVTGAKLGKEVRTRMKDGKNFGEALKTVTGAQTVASSLGRATAFVGAQTFTPQTAGHLADKWTTSTSADGFRYR